MQINTSTLKKILTVIAMQIAIVGIILCALVAIYAWVYNTPVTESLTRAAEGAERVLVAADNGLRLVNNGLRTAYGAVTAIDGITRSFGERIVETNFAFLILERTVGDTLFPRIVAAQETTSAIVGTVVGINDALEAANNIPFISVPTLSTELQAASDRLASVRNRVNEIQTGIREIKETKVARPVAFITDRTGSLIADLDSIMTTTTNAQTRINVTLSRLAVVRANLARIIDTISIVVTLVMVWFIGTQTYALIRAYEYLAGRRIDWSRFTRRGEAVNNDIEPEPVAAKDSMDVAAEASDEPDVTDGDIAAESAV